MKKRSILQMYTTCLYVLLYYSTSCGRVQGFPIKLKPAHPKSRNSQRNQTLDNALSILYAEHTLYHRRPRNINAVLDMPTATAYGRLKSRSGRFLEISGTRQIAGTSNQCSDYGIIQLQTYNRTLKRIKGKKSGLYLAINSKGKLYATRNKSNVETLFVEIHEKNYFLTYSSSQYPRGNNGTWFISLKRNGLVQRPSRTKVGMNSTQFLFIKNNPACNKS